MTRIPLRRVAAVALVWLLVASVFVAQNVVARLAVHRPLEWLPVVWFEIEYWSVFALCTPYFIRMAERFPVERDRLGRSLGAHAAGGVLFALGQPLAADALNYATLVAVGGPHDHRLGQFVVTAVTQYPLLVIIALWKYGVGIGVVSAFDYHRRLRAQEVRHARLARQFALAQLGALPMQLQPHFLFNGIHSAAMLTLSQPGRAYRFLIQLADLLRELLRSGRAEEIRVTEELDFLDRYLAIERVRFGERLTVRFEVSEEAEDTVIPALILQPLVENAIHHAFAAHSGTRTLIVRATVVDQQTVLEVEDDGPGLPAGWAFEGSARTGLRNVQARVNLVNGAETPLTFANLAPTGLRVGLIIRRRRRAAEAA